MMSRKLKDDFTLSDEVDERGNSRRVSTYIGPVFDLDIDQRRLNQLKVLAAFLYIGGLASHLAAGFLPHSASYQWYVSIPYAVAFLPIGLLGFALLRLPRETHNLGRYQTEASFTRGRLYTLFAAGLAFFSAAGLALYLLLNRKPFASQSDFLYLLLEIFVLIMFFSLSARLNQVRISTQVDNNAN